MLGERGELRRSPSGSPLGCFPFFFCTGDHTHTHTHTLRDTNLGIMGEDWVRSRIAARPAAGWSAARSLAGSLAALPSLRRGDRPPTPDPDPDAQLHRAQGSPPELAAGTRGPNASPAPESQQTQGEKVAGAASPEPGARGCCPPATERPTEAHPAAGTAPRTSPAGFAR